MKYKWIDNDVDYILLRPDNYIGSLVRKDIEDVIFDKETHKFKPYTYNISDGLIHLFNEIVSNSIDEFNNNKKVKNIKININTDVGSITISDDGSGIDVKKYENTDIYIPEILTTKLHSGSNFDDTQKRSTIGRNGVGLTIVNIFSKLFEIETSDGKNKFHMRFEQNSRLKGACKITKNKKHYTSITYIPDYKRFNYKSITDDIINYMRKKIIDLAGLFSGIRFTFKVDDIVNIYQFNNIKDYFKMFISDTSDFIYYSDENWNIGVSYSKNTFKQISFANGIRTAMGGSHVEKVLDNILPVIKQNIEKKHKIQLSNYLLKQNLKLHVNVNVINPTYDTQTKIRLDIKELPELNIPTTTFNQIINSDLFENLSKYAIQKQNEKEQQELKRINKKLNKVRIDNFIDATNRKRLNNTLYLFEGNSAQSGFYKYRNNKQGALSLKGKPNNIYKMTDLAIAKKEKIQNILSAIGLQLGVPYNNKKLRYGKIIIGTDADVDGYHITGLLLSMFYRNWKELFNDGRIYRLLTPIMVVTHKKTKKIFYTEQDYKKWTNTINDISKYKVSYKKGLASLSDAEYQDIIQNPKLIQYKIDDKSDNIIETWFGLDAELRKKQIILHH